MKWNVSKNESGNAIFIILIAIVLFAALGGAITYSSRSAGGDISKEEARVLATEVISYSNDLASTVARLRLNGCTPTEMNFENDFISGYSNGSSPTNETCHVFRANGGGLKYRDDYDMTFTGSYVITNIGTGETDLILDLRIGRDLCEAINDLLGINNSGPEGPPTDKLSAGVKFQGDYTIASTASSNQRTENAELVGKSSGCRTNSGSGSGAIFMYHRILLAR